MYFKKFNKVHFMNPFKVIIAPFRNILYGTLQWPTGQDKVVHYPNSRVAPLPTAGNKDNPNTAVKADESFAQAMSQGSSSSNTSAVLPAQPDPALVPRKMVP